MTLAEIQKQARAAVRDVPHRRGATGPTSPDGKAISSLNAVRHGLGARGVVLPGEDVDERVRRVEAAFVAFGVTSEPVARLVADIEEDLGKIERLDRIERGLLLGRIEELLKQTDTGERAKKTAHVLQTVGTACQHFVRAPFPAERGPEIERRVGMMQSALSMVSDLIESPPMDLVATCHRHLTAIADTRAHPSIPGASVNALIDGAQKLLDMLVERAGRDEAVQQELRAAIAGIALPAEAELKKLARYSKMVEESLARRLVALEALREATENITAATEEQAREFRLRLRVVK
ncbi:hypothetical protein [Anaeromyxobacter sp. SG26]|uniref:hypothetical protein n=1 Tax=Anaeromyxobacter sp. SG26 TaxID=2925407 RepID=UPI001F55EF19|nr:hypothetical protein [Anaeromyxobacter sp. SG26]